MFKRPISWIVLITFVFSLVAPYKPVHADVFGLPTPGSMVNLSPAFTPALIKGITIHKNNPFLFDFIVDTGNSGLSGEALKHEGDRLVKYFFASLTIPEKDLWVNLSPYEKNRMIPNALGQTALGRDLLAQDYILKQLTASLIYPERDLGREFWNRVYTQAQAEYGTTQIPVNTFNKVWIVADKATVYEHGQTAFVLSGHLKVMLEEDYLSLQKHQDVHSIASNIIRQIILPELEKEVNTGRNFAILRQIFYSQILATWYKKNLKEALLNQVYADKSRVRGVNLSDPSVKEKIYQQYLKAYKKGVFNYIKNSQIPNGASNAALNQSIPRKYFSGGYDSKGFGDRIITEEKMTPVEEFQATHSNGSFAMISVVDDLFSYGPMRGEHNRPKDDKTARNVKIVILRILKEGNVNARQFNQLNDSKTLEEIGLDSIARVQLAMKLEERFVLHDSELGDLKGDMKVGDLIYAVKAALLGEAKKNTSAAMTTAESFMPTILKALKQYVSQSHDENLYQYLKKILDPYFSTIGFVRSISSQNASVGRDLFDFYKNETILSVKDGEPILTVEKARERVNANSVLYRINYDDSSVVLILDDRSYVPDQAPWRYSPVSAAMTVEEAEILEQYFNNPLFQRQKITVQIHYRFNGPDIPADGFKVNKPDGRALDINVWPKANPVKLISALPDEFFNKDWLLKVKLDWSNIMTRFMEIYLDHQNESIAGRNSVLNRLDDLVFENNGFGYVMASNGHETNVNIEEFRHQLVRDIFNGSSFRMCIAPSTRGIKSVIVLSDFRMGLFYAIKRERVEGHVQEESDHRYSAAMKVAIPKNILYPSLVIAGIAAIEGGSHIIKGIQQMHRLEAANQQAALILSKIYPGSPVSTLQSSQQELSKAIYDIPASDKDQFYEGISQNYTNSPTRSDSDYQVLSANIGASLKSGQDLFDHVISTNELGWMFSSGGKNGSYGPFYMGAFFSTGPSPYSIIELERSSAITGAFGVQFDHALNEDQVNALEKIYNLTSELDDMDSIIKRLVDVYGEDLKQGINHAYVKELTLKYLADAVIRISDNKAGLQTSDFEKDKFKSSLTTGLIENANPSYHYIEWGKVSDMVAQIQKWWEEYNKTISPNARIMKKQENPSAPTNVPVNPKGQKLMAFRTPGGIDLNSANMAMTVTKDANGGVQVNFNPALITQIEKFGVESAVPVIINVSMMSRAQLMPLLGMGR